MGLYSKGQHADWKFHVAGGSQPMLLGNQRKTQEDAVPSRLLLENLHFWAALSL